MAVDKESRYLVTGDVDGWLKTWSISEYCTKAQDQVVTTPPRMFDHWFTYL